MSAPELQVGDRIYCNAKSQYGTVKQITTTIVTNKDGEKTETRVHYRPDGKRKLIEVSRGICEYSPSTDEIYQVAEGLRNKRISKPAEDVNAPVTITECCMDRCRKGSGSSDA